MNTITEEQFKDKAVQQKVFSDADEGIQTTILREDGTVRSVIGLDKVRHLPDPCPDPLDEMLTDWAREAANEIGSEVIYDHLVDGLGTMRSIIAKHCPFKPDVAYIPVPRCETCKHWQQGKHASDYCRLLYMSIPTNFGCVRWEAKRCQFTFDVLVNGERKRCGLQDGHDGLHAWREKA